MILEMHQFNPQIYARFVRINVVSSSYTGCARFELYGCFTDMLLDIGKKSEIRNKRIFI